MAICEQCKYETQWPLYCEECFGDLVMERAQGWNKCNAAGAERDKLKAQLSEACDGLGRFPGSTLLAQVSVRMEERNDLDDKLTVARAEHDKLRIALNAAKLHNVLTKTMADAFDKRGRLINKLREALRDVRETPHDALCGLNVGRDDCSCHVGMANKALSDTDEGGG